VSTKGPFTEGSDFVPGKERRKLLQRKKKIRWGKDILRFRQEKIMILEKGEKKAVSNSQKTAKREFAGKG